MSGKLVNYQVLTITNAFGVNTFYIFLTPEPEQKSLYFRAFLFDPAAHALSNSSFFRLVTVIYSYSLGKRIRCMSQKNDSNTKQIIKRLIELAQKHSELLDEQRFLRAYEEKMKSVAKKYAREI